MCNYITAHATVFISFALTLHRCTIFFLLRSWRLPDNKHGGWGDSCTAEHPPHEVRQQQNFPWLLKKRKRSSARCNCSQVFSPAFVPMCWTRGANQITLGKLNIRQDNLGLPETSIIKGLHDWVWVLGRKMLFWTANLSLRWKHGWGVLGLHHAPVLTMCLLYPCLLCRGYDHTEKILAVMPAAPLRSKDMKGKSWRI